MDLKCLGYLEKLKDFIYTWYFWIYGRLKNGKFHRCLTSFWDLAYLWDIGKYAGIKSF